MNEYFRFKNFSVSHRRSSMKVGTDGVLLGAWVSVDRVTSILDVGTGTGLIALMLAQRTPSFVRIDAVEINSNASQDAQENFDRSPWKNRLNLFHTPIQKFVKDGKYDLIVSNPPYFVNSFKPTDKSRETARHSESLLYDDLLLTISRYLQPLGRVALILPSVEAKLFTTKSIYYNLHCNRMCEFSTRDHKNPERILLEFSFQKQPISLNKLCLYKSGDEWTNEYHDLVKDFYLKG